jgi:hypothetical protein
MEGSDPSSKCSTKFTASRACPYGMHTSLERQAVRSVELLFHVARAEPGW